MESEEDIEVGINDPQRADIVTSINPAKTPDQNNLNAKLLMADPEVHVAARILESLSIPIGEQQLIPEDWNKGLGSDCEDSKEWCLCDWNNWRGMELIYLCQVKSSVRSL